MEHILAMVGTGAVSGLISWGAVRSDLQWLKDLVKSQDKRITYLERKE